MTRQTFCEVLKISLRVITYSEVTIFLGVSNSLEVTFLLRVTIFLAKVAYSARSTCVKGTSTEGVSTESTGTCIKDASTCASGACIGAWSADIKDDFIGNTRVGYTSGIGAIKCLGIYLRSSHILELE